MAIDLAKRGWNLWIHFRNSEQEAQALASRIEALGRRARTVRADLSVSGGVESLVAAVALLPPALVVHSASMWTEDTFDTAGAESWERSHRLHVWSALVLARSLAQWSLGASTEGHLVTVVDARSRDRDPRHFSYAFAKRELALLTRYLAVELAPGVRVNGLAPGPILKAEGVSSVAWNKVGREATPLGRTGKPGDLIRALRYLVDNRFVTGQILAIDGGRHLLGDLFGSI